MRHLHYTILPTSITLTRYQRSHDLLETDIFSHIYKSCALFILKGYLGLMMVIMMNYHKTRELMYNFAVLLFLAYFNLS